MPKSKREQQAEDSRKRAENLIKRRGMKRPAVQPPPAPPLVCPSEVMFAFRCTGGSFNQILFPGYTVGTVSWDPPYGPGNGIPLNRGNLINGQNPQPGDYFEVPATILSTDCITGVQTMRNIPAAYQGHYYVSHTYTWNSSTWPSNFTPTEFVDYPLSTATPCGYIGNPLKVCLCSVGPGGTGFPGQIFDAMVTTGSLSGWTANGVPQPGRFFGNCTIDGATAVVGQEFEITLAGGVDNFLTFYANWAWPPAPGIGNMSNVSFTSSPPNFPASGMTDLIGVLKVMEVYPQFDYWNPPTTHNNPYTTFRSWVFYSTSTPCTGAGVCGNPITPCDPIWLANIFPPIFGTGAGLPGFGEGACRACGLGAYAYLGMNAAVYLNNQQNTLSPNPNFTTLGDVCDYLDANNCCI